MKLPFYYLLFVLFLAACTSSPEPKIPSEAGQSADLLAPDFDLPVIDSDDLLENPEGIVKAWCQAVGIPFIAEALSWEPGDRDEVSWYDGGSWHGNLRGSDGLKPQPRKYIDISDAPDRVKRIYDIALPHYLHMYQYRLQGV